MVHCQLVYDYKYLRLYISINIFHLMLSTISICIVVYKIIYICAYNQLIEFTHMTKIKKSYHTNLLTINVHNPSFLVCELFVLVSFVMIPTTTVDSSLQYFAKKPLHYIRKPFANVRKWFTNICEGIANIREWLTKALAEVCKRK